MSNKPTLKIAPVEPTEEMESVSARIYREDDDDPEIIASNNVSTWNAMLQASPPAPSVEEIKKTLSYLLRFSAYGSCGPKDRARERAANLLAQFEAMESQESK